MPLRDLVQFTHNHISSEVSESFRSPPPPLGHETRTTNEEPQLAPEPLAQTDNAPFADRPPFPSWLTQPTGEIVRVTGLGNLSIEDQGAVEAMTAAVAVDRIVGRMPSGDADALAFYLPYHFYSAQVWGIYLRATGVVHLANAIKGSGIGPGDSKFLQVAEQVLFDHEYYHCVAEAAATRAEVVVGRPVYHSYFWDKRAAPHEEALANAYAYRQLIRNSVRHPAAVRQWMSKQGSGYRDFGKYVKKRDFEQGQGQCGRHIIRRISPMVHIPAALPVEFLFGKVPAKSVPIYLVIEDAIARCVLKPFPKFNGLRVWAHRSREHPPPHIHIEIPPGKERTRYVWPQLEPMKGDPKLSGAERKMLSGYLTKYGSEILESLTAVYPNHELGMPAL